MNTNNSAQEKTIFLFFFLHRSFTPQYYKQKRLAIMRGEEKPYRLCHFPILFILPQKEGHEVT